MYTASQIFRENLLLKADGQPYKSFRSVRKRLQNEGIKKTVVNDKGISIYQVTKKQLLKMNGYE